MGENMESPRPPHVKKAKKKQVKDELDRMKQAEKKRRRLEKALATSAAIRSELERKKQQKKEEQQRLDEEGAAIAEAVALHVLLGEDSDDKPKIVLNQDQDFGDWHYAANISLFMEGSTLSHENLERITLGNIGWFPRADGHGCEWNPFGNTKPYEKMSHIPCFEDVSWSHDDYSAGLIAAQAISSLQIGENTHVDAMYFNGY